MRFKHKTLTFLSCLLLGTALGVATNAQTGPFKDGELLVMTSDVSSGDTTLYRIDAATGDGEALIDTLWDGYLLPGGFAFDPFRGEILIYGSDSAFGIFSPRLLSVDEDGVLLDRGFAGQALSSFAPVGDGRVYMCKAGQLHVLDSSDQLIPVLDAADQPINLPLSHIIFEPSQNALFGVSSPGFTTSCSGFNAITVNRLPLDSSGLKLAGTIDCVSYSFLTGMSPVGLDHLPQGQLQITMSGAQFSADKVILSFDTSTMGFAVQAQPDSTDHDGGVWCQRIGRSVVLDDVGNQLLSFAPGESGPGQLIPADVPVGNSQTGVSPLYKMEEIDLLGPGCAGLSYAFGQGLGGSGGITPILSNASCPAIGTSLQFSVQQGVGGGLGVLLGAQSTLAYSILGGTGYVLPPFEVQLGLFLGGTTGTPGSGTGIVTVPVPNDISLLNIPFFFQAGILDSGAPANISLTQALEVRLG